MEAVYESHHRTKVNLGIGYMGWVSVRCITTPYIRSFPWSMQGECGETLLDLTPRELLRSGSPSVTKYIEKRLRLVVKVDKSRVSTSTDGVSLLSFDLKRKDDGEIRIGISKRAQKKVDKKGRELTPRNLGGTFEGCLKGIRTYFNGWFSYFRLATTGTVFKELDAHIRRRLRQILACLFKRPRYLYRHLLRLGITTKSAAKAFYEIRSPWAHSISPALNKANRNAWFAERLTPLYDRWLEIHPPKDLVIKQFLLFE